MKIKDELNICQGRHLDKAAETLRRTLPTMDSLKLQLRGSATINGRDTGPLCLSSVHTVARTFVIMDYTITRRSAAVNQHDQLLGLYHLF